MKRAEDVEHCDGPYMTFSYTYIHSQNLSRIVSVSFCWIFGNEFMCMKMSQMVHRRNTDDYTLHMCIDNI